MQPVDYPTKLQSESQTTPAGACKSRRKSQITNHKSQLTYAARADAELMVATGKNYSIENCHCPRPPGGAEARHFTAILLLKRVTM